jgi:ABC-2 type transport system ATP-binding protein
MADTADEVVVIARGRIAAHGPLDEITAGHASLENAFFALTGDQGPGW